MVRADIIDCVDRILRVFQEICVCRLEENSYCLSETCFSWSRLCRLTRKEILSLFYASPFFFSARVFKSINLVPIELQKVYRQADPVFINILDRIRAMRQEDRSWKF